MADQVLNDILAGPVMTQLANSEAVKPGLPWKLPDALIRPAPEKPAGMEVIWWEVTGHRQLAAVVHHMSPPQRAEVEGVVKREATAIGTKEEINIDQEMLLKLKSPLPFVQQGARNIITTRLRNFRLRAENLRRAVVISALAKGNLYLDAKGNVLPTSTGAKRTISFNIPTANVLAKTDTIDGVTIGDWSSSTTDIPLALRAIRTGSIKASNYEPRHILYGKSIPSYFANNTSMQAYFSRNQFLGKEFVDTNEVPKGTLDYEWHPVGASYFKDANGTVQSWWPDNLLVVLPEITPEWYEFYEGGVLVPRGTMTAGQSIDEIVAQCDLVNGPFAYTEFDTKTVSANVIAGDYSLPAIKVPGVVYQITVS